MFGRDVITSPSSDAPAGRTCSGPRRLSASLGACDMDGVEPVFEGGQRAARACAFGVFERFCCFPLQLTGNPFQLGIARGERQRRLRMHECFSRGTALLVDVDKPASRSQVVRGSPGDAVEDIEGGVEISELQQRPSERDACGQVVGMMLEAGAADVDGVLETPRAAVFLGELRERNRRRVFLHPASQVFKP